VTLWQTCDPRAKTYFAVTLSLCLVLVPATRAWFFLPAVFLLLWSAGISRERFWILVRAVLALWSLSFLMNAWLIRGPRVGPEALGVFRPSLPGLKTGFDHGARLAGLAGVGAWLAATTGVLELAASLEWMVRRWPSLRRRVHRALLPVVLAVRLVPLLVEEGRRLIEVERLRRGPRGRGRELVRLARLAPLWMVLVVERAEALALALTLRGYDPERPRSFAQSYQMRAVDWGLVLLGTLALAGSAA
jgi:energy-coupling factor transport system permease protein